MNILPFVSGGETHLARPDVFRREGGQTSRYTAPPSAVNNLKRYKRCYVKSFLDSREKYD
ncbi:hypothetical protein GCM10010520_40810 [Rhizobium viscosum]